MVDGDTMLHAVGAGLALAIVGGLVVVGLNFAGAAGEGDVPDAEWDIQRVNDSHVRVTHVGGEPVGAENLQVTANGVPRRADWPDTVTEADNVTVDAATGAVVRVVYLGGRTDRVTLARERL